MKNRLAVKPISRQALRNKAKAIRLLCGLGDEPLDVPRFLEYVMQELFPDLAVEIVDKFENESGKCGEFDLFGNAIRIPEDRYEKAIAGDGRARFDIIHECCHKFLITYENLAFCRYTRELKAYEDPEWQADCMAGELLMPAEKIRGMSVDDVASVFGVTPKAASTQLSKV
jgi:hypothetical protein